MSFALLLIIIAGLFLLFGIIALTMILLVAKRSKAQFNPKKTGDNQSPCELNPWEEAGNRLSPDSDEPSGN